MCGAFLNGSLIDRLKNPKRYIETKESREKCSDTENSEFWKAQDERSISSYS